MRNSIIKHLMLATTVSVLVFTSCKKDNSNPAPSGSQRVFITCEGPFTSGTGTVSSYSKSTGEVANDLFGNANGIPLGNIVQSMAINGSYAYIVVNNAGKIKVVNKNTFVQTAEIVGLNQPRYMIVKNNTGYVSEWGTGSTGSVRVIDLSANTIINTISVGEGPEGLLEHNGKIYVCNSGAFNSANTISVIDIASNTVSSTITVGINPTHIVKDKNGMLWVICNGTVGNLNGTLEKINPATNSVETSIPLNTDGYQIRLSSNVTGDKIYFNQYMDVKVLDVTTETISTFISRGVYSLACDPISNSIFLSDAVNFSSNGKVIRYSLNNATVIDSFSVGIIPGNFCFE